MDVIKIIFGGEMMIVCHAMAHKFTLAYSSMRNEEFENEEFLARKTD